MLDFPQSKNVKLPEITMQVHEAGSGPAVVLLHGFPELALSWQPQVRALADAGFHVIAPNQRGYGWTDAPQPIESYDLIHLTDDIAALLDKLGIERAVFAGHDWGGFVAWAMPIRHPQRCLGVIGVNTPYIQFPTTAQLRMVFPDPEKLYILWFQQPGVAEALMDRKVRTIFEKLMRRAVKPEVASMTQLQDANPFRRIDALPAAGESLLTKEELDAYVAAYEHSGFRGGINWYRNIDRNSKLVPELGVKKLTLPCLQVTAAWDVAIPPAMADGMPALCSDLKRHDIQACGHWTQREQPAELNRAMIDWLKARFK
jgi:epoxide hydrolase A/B